MTNEKLLKELNILQDSLVDLAREAREFRIRLDSLAISVSHISSEIYRKVEDNDS